MARTVPPAPVRVHAGPRGSVVRMLFRQLLDFETCTYTYVLADPQTREAVIIDAVRENVDRDVATIGELGLRLLYAVETHVHADHVSGASLLQQRLGCQTAVSSSSGADADVKVADWGALRFG